MPNTFMQHKIAICSRSPLKLFTKSNSDNKRHFQINLNIICLFLLLGSVILTFNDNLNISIKNKSYNIKIGPNDNIHTCNSYDKYLTQQK